MLRAMAAPAHVFQRFGGSYQHRLRDFADLRAAVALDESHWAVTACPVADHACDRRFLELLDDDGNGRIRVDELRRAVGWFAEQLTDFTDADRARSGLIIGNIRDEKLRSLARQILENQGAGGGNDIPLDKIRADEASLRASGANGDGIVTPGACPEGGVREVCAAILDCLPGVEDRSGNRGVDLATIEAFETAIAASLAWFREAGTTKAWNGDTAEAAALIERLRSPVDAWFALCAAAALDEEVGTVELDPDRIDAAWPDPEALDAYLREAPIAEPVAGGSLNWRRLAEGPWKADLLRLREVAIKPVLGQRNLDRDGWARLRALSEAFRDWERRGRELALGGLGEAQLAAIDGEALDQLRELCRRDADLEPLFARLDDLEKLALYQRWLLPFARSFVALPDLYHRQPSALFEQGTLVIGGRRFGLSLPVHEADRHASIAAGSGIFLLYVRCRRVDGDTAREFTVAVPVTGGSDRDYYPHRPGLFIDERGDHFDATVERVLDQPISIFQAIWRPFRRLGGFVTEQVEKWSRGSERRFDEHLAATAGVAEQPAPESRPPVSGLLMGGGVAIAALGSGLAIVVNQLGGMSGLELLVGFGIALALVIAPTALLAWLKLRRRNLAVLLEAGGWAVNDPLRLSYRLRRLITREPSLPKGSRLEPGDRLLAELREAGVGAWQRHRPWLLTALLVAIAASVALLAFFRG